ncbi:hypothetical protein I7I50_08593 [Histoplasma capsulatum G186AR]|uniref:Uncharacterized protein n=1 Tax=Ajellomyces capsulatus TaxID=5037 RepID=A0A8H8CZQ6_AJECA|nr:hypothetical protein I7I52_06108 [Histoplasma capsulatum]QSS73710.1 hypothetical protein I7I50_08593 [Histoplasma capsulatum G186AR]
MTFLHESGSSWVPDPLINSALSDSSREGVHGPINPDIEKLFTFHKFSRRRVLWLYIQPRRRRRGGKEAPQEWVRKREQPWTERMTCKASMHIKGFGTDIKL